MLHDDSDPNVQAGLNRLIRVRRANRSRDVGGISITGAA